MKDLKEYIGLLLSVFVYVLVVLVVEFYDDDDDGFDDRHDIEDLYG